MFDKNAHKTRVFLFSASLGTPRQPQAAHKLPQTAQRDPRGTPKEPTRMAHGNPRAFKKSQSDPKDVERETQGTPKDPKRLQSQPQGWLASDLGGSKSREN